MKLGKTINFVFPFFIMEYYIVDSVKGGCGKTSISFKLAIQKALSKPKKKNSEVCIVDLDFLGSSMEIFIKGDLFVERKKFFPIDDSKDTADHAESEYSGFSSSGTTAIRKINGYNLNVKTQADTYLTDIFTQNFTNECEVDLANRIEVVNARGSSTSSCFFDVFISSPFQDDKNMFKANKESKFIEQVDYDYFRTKLINFFKYLEKKYSCVIIDMPPNSDSYTDMVFEILMRKNSPLLNNRNRKVNIMLVSSQDRALFHANIEWLKKFISNCDYKNICIDAENLTMVINCTVDVNKISEYFSIKEEGYDNLIYKRRNNFSYQMQGLINKTPKFKLYCFDFSAACSSQRDAGIVFESIEPKQILE